MNDMFVTLSLMLLVESVQTFSLFFFCALQIISPLKWNSELASQSFKWHNVQFCVTIKALNKFEHLMSSESLLPNIFILHVNTNKLMCLFSALHLLSYLHMWPIHINHSRSHITETSHVWQTCCSPAHSPMDLKKVFGRGNHRFGKSILLKSSNFPP